MASEDSKMEDTQLTCETSKSDAEKQLSDVTALPEEKTDTANEDDGAAAAEVEKEMVNFKIVYNKQKHEISFPLDDTVTQLKEYLEKKTGVPAAMQKVMYKGRMNDAQTLRENKVLAGAKIMLVGSTLTEIMSVTAPDVKALKEEIKKEEEKSKEPLSKQKPHKVVLEKHGKPDDAVVGVKGTKLPVPPQPLSGMYNKAGGKVRLTFKMELDQLWIGTKERTQKIPMASIKAVVSEALDGNEDYHMLAIQLGPTAASQYWIYWVPAQYVDAIKDSILGKWQFY